jgi:FtsH-binding integral membrane protein
MSSTTYKSVGDVNTAMSRVYGQMGLAVVTSMIVSFLIGTSPALMTFFFTGAMKWIVIFAPLVVVLAVSFAWERFSRSALTFFLHGFAALMGLSFATIFVAFNMGSIVSAFMSAAVLFGVMSVYGYFTKKNLDTIGQYLFVGLVAIVIASIVNIFIGSSLFQMVISAMAVIVFLGLTAYDTQKIRELVSVDTDGRAEVMGALTLYLDFINLFLSLLQIFGGRREE